RVSRSHRATGTLGINIIFITRWFRFLIRQARTMRYEILLPLNHTDGADIEPEKFDQTADELSDHFGAITQDTVRISGTGKYGGTRYRDTLIRIRIDTTDPAATTFIRTQKDLWRERVRQIDIWIT